MVSLSTSSKALEVNILSSSTIFFPTDNPTQIHLKTLIGKGTYSYVYTLHSPFQTNNKTKYVIKLMKPSYSKKDIKQIKNRTKDITDCKHFYMCENYREIDIAKKLISTPSSKYPTNLVRIAAYGQLTAPTILTNNRFFPKGTYIIIEQYYRSFQKYFTFPNKPTNLQLIKFIFDMKQAFKQLYSITNYIHLDPKLSNIYISNDGKKFLLSDFNLVQQHIPSTSPQSPQLFKSYGLYYLHPQHACPLLSLPYYSLAITLLELVYSRSEVYYLDTLQGVSHTDYVKRILEEYKKSRSCDKSMYSFITRCLSLKCKVTKSKDGEDTESLSPTSASLAFSKPKTPPRAITPPNTYPSPSSVPSNIKLYHMMEPKSL